MDFLTFIRENLAHAAPILVAGAISLAIVLERCFTLFFRYPMKNTERFFAQISKLVAAGQIPEAMTLCDRNAGSLPCRVVKTALGRAHLPEGVIQDGLLLTIQQCNHQVMKRTNFLTTFANVATLLGLFGTVAGLIQSFQAVANADAQQKSALLAAGISTAMNATMMGLGVAIPCMLAYSFLMNRSNQITAECEQAGIRILDILKQRFYSSEVSSTEAEAHKMARAA
jgi:biopolymer transport protein ExbB/TolQ